MDKENWKKEYENGATNDCPFCSGEKPEHSCRNCYCDISKDICWRCGGYCEKCFDYIHYEISKLEAEKEKLGVKCKCNNPNCSKCLGVNCNDDNCPVHTKEAKEIYHRNWEKSHRSHF